MKKLFYGILALLTIMSFTLQAGPYVPPKPRPSYDVTKACTIINAEYQNVKNLSFVIPKNTVWNQCLKFSGHSDEVGVFIQRDLKTSFDRFNIEIFLGTQFVVHSIEERDNFPTKKVIPADKRRTIINLSDEAGASPSAIIAAKFSLPAANVDRRVVFFYESSESGATILSVAVVEVNTSSSANSYIKTNAIVEGQVSTTRSGVPAETITAEDMNGSAGLYLENSYVAIDSNTLDAQQFIPTCTSGDIPPPGINSTGRSFNKVLTDIELHRGSFYVENTGQSKFLDVILAGDAQNAKAHGIAVSVTAYLAVQRFGGDKALYSYALGAADALSPVGASTLSLIEAHSGFVDVTQYKRGSNYTKNVYLKDQNRKNIKDSCSREEDLPEDDDIFPYCTKPVRTFMFKDLSRVVTTYEAHPFDYGEKVDLKFSIDTFGNGDAFWVIAEGSENVKAHRVYETDLLIGKDQFYLYNYQTSISGKMYMNAINTDPRYDSGSGIKIVITCTPHLPLP